MKTFRLALAVSLTLSAAAFAGKSDCRSGCAQAKIACESACRDPKGAGKTKKGAADCIRQMCETVVKQCEGQCNGKK